MQEVFEQQDIQEDSLALGAVKKHKRMVHRNNSKWRKYILFKIDTGAAVTAIPTKLYDYRRDGPLMESKKKTVRAQK